MANLNTSFVVGPELKLTTSQLANCSSYQLSYQPWLEPTVPTLQYPDLSGIIIQRDQESPQTA